MCRILGLSRQSYYYQSKPKKDESELEEVVAEEKNLSAAERPTAQEK
jgi:putative transposase